MQRFKHFPQTVSKYNLNKKAMSKSAVYLLLFSFFVVYQIYFFNFIQIIFAASPGPQYYNLNVNPSSPTTYSQGGNYQFNATWTSGNGLSSVIFEFNGTNSTVSTSQGSEYYTTKNNYGAGNYLYRWLANDTLGNWNATWGDTSFIYRKPITISSTSSLTDYQIVVTTDTSSLVSVGKMQSGCQDMRFTDSDGYTNLDYWIESGCNSASTKIWVKVPSISTSGTKIYMYYGNSSVTAASSFSDTFPKANILNADISSGSSSTPGFCPASSPITSWSIACRSDIPNGQGPDREDDGYGISGHDGYAYAASASYNYRDLYQIVDITGYIPFRFSFNGRSAFGGAGSCIPCGISATCGDSHLLLYYLDSGGSSIGSSFFWWYYYGLSQSQITNNCGYSVNYQLTGGDTWTTYTYTNDTNLIPSSTNKANIAKVEIYTTLYTGGEQVTQRFDDFEVYLRKYSSPEPTSSIGTEEIGQNYTINKASGAVSFSLSPSSQVSYPIQTNASCIRTAGDSTSTITLYRNGSQVSSGTTSPQSEVTTLIGGIYNYTCVIPATQNYTEATSASNILIVISNSPNITIFFNSSKVWWNDSVYASGLSLYSNGTVDVGSTYTFYINGANQCGGSTNSSGGWSCTFRAPIEIGSFAATVSTSSTSNSTTLYVRPKYGPTPSGTSDRTVYENPFFIQDMNGKLKMVMVRITTWKR